MRQMLNTIGILLMLTAVSSYQLAFVPIPDMGNPPLLSLSHNGSRLLHSRKAGISHRDQGTIQRTDLSDFLTRRQGFFPRSGFAPFSVPALKPTLATDDDRCTLSLRALSDPDAST